MERVGIVNQNPEKVTAVHLDTALIESGLERGVHAASTSEGRAPRAACGCFGASINTDLTFRAVALILPL
jgi:hypothetical protein